MKLFNTEDTNILLETRVSGLKTKVVFLNKKICKLEKENNELKLRVVLAEEKLQPALDSVNKLTPEKSKWLRREKRAKNKL